MFKKACNFYWNLVCQIGGGSKVHKGKLHGSGCLLSSEIALSALHIINETSHLYDYPVILKNDGVYKAKVILEIQQNDVVLLQCVEKIKSADIGTISRYPDLNFPNPFIGTSVGYLAGLHLKDDSYKDSRHTFFSQAFVSALMKNENDGISMMLSQGIVQKGFSGSPVFTNECELIGILTNTIQFTFKEGHPMPIIYTLPVMSPLYVNKDKIRKFLT